LTSVRDAARTAAALVIGWRARLSSTRAGIVIVYHRVGGTEPSDPQREILPTGSADAFVRQLRHLRRRYRVVPARQILVATHSRRRLRRFPVAITFDDDLESHVRDALTALRRARLTATFFVGGASLEQAHAFWWEDLQRAIDDRLIEPDGIPHVSAADVRAALDRVPRAILELTGAIVRLTSPQRADVAAALRAAAGPPTADTGLRATDVRALAEGGSTVGWHTLWHDVLPSLPDAQLEQAFAEGRDRLATAAGQKLDLIAYPHGKADERVTAVARGGEFALGFTTARGVVTSATDPFLVPRTVADLAPGTLALRLSRAFAERQAD